MADDGAAHGGLVGDLVLEGVGLGGADEGDLGCDAVAVDQRDGAADGNGQAVLAALGVLRVGEDG